MPILEPVNRKIYFFRIADLPDFRDKLEPAVKVIEELPFNEQGRYQAYGGDDTVLALFIGSATFPIKLQFARIRRNNLPLVEKGGDVSTLSLDDKAGLMDSCHLVIFNDGIVAAEFNQDAPRIRRLGQYLYFKAAGQFPSSPKFLPLFQKDVLEELESFPNITILEIEANASEAEVISEADENVGAALRACRNAGATRRASLTLSSSPKNEPLLKGLARRLFSSSKTRESLTRLKVVGGSGPKRKPLDMLEEYLVSTERFPRSTARSKGIDTEAAYETLIEAYRKNQHRFAGAATANETWG